MRAAKLLHRILTLDSFDLWPLFLSHIIDLLQNATPSPFLTRFWFCLLYMIALDEGFKISWQNFDLCSLWPLTYLLQYATTSPFLTWFWFCLLYDSSTRRGPWNFYRILTFDFYFCYRDVLQNATPYISSTNSLMPV